MEKNRTRMNTRVNRKVPLSDVFFLLVANVNTRRIVIGMLNRDKEDYLRNKGKGNNQKLGARSEREG